MSDRYIKILRESFHKANSIPSGRQLPRTPPLTDVKRHLDFHRDDSNVACEEPEQNAEQADPGDQDDHDQNGTFEFSTPEIKTGNDPSSMLKGMKGYQLTPGDLEFIKKMKEEKLIKKYQGDLEKMNRLLTKETASLEAACALRDNAQAELDKFPSCEELREWVTAVLKNTSPSTELPDLVDTKAVLAMVTKGSVQRAMDAKRVQLARMEKLVANKRKKEAIKRGQHEKQIANEQLKILELTSLLSDLKSELAQQEEAYKALQVQLKTREEIQVEGAEDPSADRQAGKSQVKSRGKERKKGVKSTDKLLDTTNQTRLMSKCADRKADEQSDSQESQAARGRKKPPGTVKSAAGQQKNQRKARTEVQPASQQAAPSRSRKRAAVAAGDAAEEAQSAGLRRSKRIASRR